MDDVIAVVVRLDLSGCTKTRDPVAAYAVVKDPLSDFDPENLIVPDACKSSDSEPATVESVCSESVEDTVVFVEDKPEPDWIIFIPVALARFVKDIAELLSEYTFL